MAPSDLLAIFDHDGVLVDSLDHHQRAWVDLGRSEGLPITAEFIRDSFGMTNPSIFARLLGREIDAESLARLSDAKEASYRALARDEIRLLPGVHALLDGLTSHGVRLAVGTSGVLPNILLTIESCGLEGRFAAIASLEDIKRGKPDPEVFLVAARKAGVDPRRAVVFEDATFGIQAARAAGMRAVGITTTTTADALFAAGADEVVDTFVGYDLERLIRTLASA